MRSPSFDTTPANNANSLLTVLLFCTACEVWCLLDMLPICAADMTAIYLQLTLPVVLFESCNVWNVFVKNQSHEGDIVRTIVLDHMCISLTGLLFQPTRIGKCIGTAFPVHMTTQLCLEWKMAQSNIRLAAADGLSSLSVLENPGIRIAVPVRLRQVRGPTGMAYICKSGLHEQTCTK